MELQDLPDEWVEMRTGGTSPLFHVCDDYIETGKHVRCREEREDVELVKIGRREWRVRTKVSVKCPRCHKEVEYEYDWTDEQ